MNAILEKARLQLSRYTSLLPNVIGLEEGDSQGFVGEKLKREVRFTAHLRMMHKPLPKLPNRVTEEAEFLTENGKPVHKTPRDIPFYLVDIFTNQDPSILPVPAHCVSYKILPSEPGSILLERWIHPLTPAEAHFCEGANIGEIMRITLDAGTMQMTRIDRPAQPRKDLEAGWEIGFSYDYTEQRIGEKRYLLPARVESTLLKPDHGIRKTFEASYSDYRRYGSTATISLPEQP